MASRSVAALLYHHVGPVREPACRGLTVLPEAFARQMSTLSAMGWAAILPADWVAHVKEGADIPERSVIITFDDAYADLTEYALPVLEKHGYPATIFVATSLVGGTIGCNPRYPDATMRIMSAEQVAYWAARGVSFGAHSQTHSDLTSLPLSTASLEITGSLADLRTLTGRDVSAFAYPYGKVNDEIAALVRAHFQVAFTIEEGLNDSAVPLHALRRSMVQHGDSMVDVLLRARYGKSVLQRIRNIGRAPAQSEINQS